MSFWTLESIRKACGGLVTARGDDAALARIAGVSIDSRSIKPGQVFFAIRGETFDGHAFAPPAARAGAPLLIVERDPAEPCPGPTILRVPDTRAALLRLAAAYRASLEHTKVIAVCGSNGKTTTTRLIHAVLGAKLRGTCPAKSFNNDIGVPLTILSARETDQYLLCEVGSNAPGEIAALAAVVKPDVAVITSIGREHLQGFGSLEGVAREEAAILSELGASGAAIVTADTELLADALRGVVAAGRVAVTFGRSTTADLRLTGFEHFASGASAEGGLDSLRLTVNDRATFKTTLVGEHNALNALAAIAVGRRLGLNDAEIAAGLSKAIGPDMRMQRLTLGGVDVINDAYNANPESTLAALRTFAALHGRAARRVIVLGDNLELGAAAESSHREIGQEIARLGGDLLVVVGPAGSARRGRSPARRDERRASPGSRLGTRCAGGGSLTPRRRGAPERLPAHGIGTNRDGAPNTRQRRDDHRHRPIRRRNDRQRRPT